MTRASSFLSLTEVTNKIEQLAMSVKGFCDDTSKLLDDAKGDLELMDARIVNVINDGVKKFTSFQKDLKRIK